MKKTLKPKKLKFHKDTVRVLTTNDMQDVVGGTSAACTKLADCTDLCPTLQSECFP